MPAGSALLPPRCAYVGDLAAEPDNARDRWDIRSSDHTIRFPKLPVITPQSLIPKGRLPLLPGSAPKSVRTPSLPLECVIEVAICEAIRIIRIGSRGGRHAYHRTSTVDEPKLRRTGRQVGIRPAERTQVDQFVLAVLVTGGNLSRELSGDRQDRKYGDGNDETTCSKSHPFSFAEWSKLGPKKPLGHGPETEIYPQMNVGECGLGRVSE